ncbi:type IV pilin PilA [Microcystis aeruginosa NIES-44]|uniref:Type IV pilin PilA n=1 Tax=Microcystis aeruginosa NIES-44 TaxID=449439 RepID=A0A0A1VXT2_MICAE|nr:type IV pilin PilA [Microcystis aeruginosa NIES-44]
MGVGCGVWASAVSSAERVWGFSDFEGVNYLIFREKVPEFSPRSLPCPVLFD